MSVVARDESTAPHIIFPWPDPLPWGVELVCSDDEVAIICPNWQVGEQLGPGRHTISPPNPQSHILAYFVRTTAEIISFDKTISVIDRGTNQTVRVAYEGRAKIKVGDPTLMCHQLVGLPYHDLATGVIRSAQNSLGKVFQHVITKICMASPSISTIASNDAVAQLVQMGANANPMAIAVTGLELVNFEEFRLSIDGDEPIEWAANALDAEDAKTSQLELEKKIPSKTARLHSPVLSSGPKTARLPPADDSPAETTGEKVLEEPEEETLPVGAKVLVYGNDGLWHAATVQQYSDGRYSVTAEGGNTPVWVPANQVRPQ